MSHFKRSSWSRPLLWKTRCVYHASLFLNAVLNLCLKWLSAVFFQKIFQKISQSSLEGGRVFVPESNFWKTLFLEELSFEQVLLVYAIVLVGNTTFSGISNWATQVLAATDEFQRRKLVLHYTLVGKEVSGGFGSEKASVLLSYSSAMYEYEAFVKQRRIRFTYELILGQILGFVFLPPVAAVCLGTVLMTDAVNRTFYCTFLNSIRHKLQKKKEKLFLLCFDIARCADVIAVSNMEEREEEFAAKLSKDVLSLESKNALVTFFHVFTADFVLLSLIGTISALVFYQFENLSKSNPLELVFSLFAVLNFAEQVHKSKIYLDATLPQSKQYSETKNLVFDWFESMKKDSKGENDNNDGDSSILVSVTNSFSSLSDIEIGEVAGSATWMKGNIILNNISITYYEKHPSIQDSVSRSLQSSHGITAVQNRSFVFNYRESTALVGESGSGKSSILKAMGGLLTLSEGEIWFGSLEMNEDNREVIRDELAFCSQDSLLFARSIRENIWFGNSLDCDDNVILDSLSKVGLSDWLSKQPKGLNTVLTTAEKQVSGGQAQRLQLARLLCKNKEYYLLDEACSALDSGNRTRIVGHLKRHMKNATVVWITHNSEVVSSLDNVVDITTRNSESL